jgi:hypothetical protein
MSTVRCWPCGKEVAVAEGHRVTVQTGQNSGLFFGQAGIGVSDGISWTRVDMCRPCALAAMTAGDTEHDPVIFFVATGVAVVFIAVLAIFAWLVCSGMV